MKTIFGPKEPTTYDSAYAASEIRIFAGNTLTLTVDFGGQHQEFTFECPDEVSITEPTENTEVSPDDQITVRWSGATKYPNSLFGPILNLFEYDPATGTNISLLASIPITWMEPRRPSISPFPQLSVRSISWSYSPPATWSRKIGSRAFEG